MHLLLLTIDKILLHSISLRFREKSFNISMYMERAGIQVCKKRNTFHKKGQINVEEAARHKIGFIPNIHGIDDSVGGR